MLNQPIGSVMTPALFAIEACAPLRLARTVMLREKIHQLPVVCAGRPVGLLTERDLQMVTYLANDLLGDDELTAGDVCVPDPYTAELQTLITEVLTEMARRHLPAALVVDQGLLVGLYSTHDACAELAAICAD